MIASFTEVLAERIGTDQAVGSFTCYTLKHGRAVVEAAETHGDPVILMLAESAFRRRTGVALVQGLVTIARRSNVVGCVQLDHARDLGLIRGAIEAGVGAVMVDGGHLSLRDNIDRHCCGNRSGAT